MKGKELVQDDDDPPDWYGENKHIFNIYIPRSIYSTDDDDDGELFLLRENVKT